MGRGLRLSNFPWSPLHFASGRGKYSLLPDRRTQQLASCWTTPQLISEVTSFEAFCASKEVGQHGAPRQGAVTRLAKAAAAAASKDAAAASRHDSAENIVLYNFRLAKIIVDNLRPELCLHIMSTIPADHQFDGVYLWTTINTKYGAGLSSGRMRASENAESKLLKALATRWNGREPLTSYLRRMEATRLELAVLPKMADHRPLCDALLVKSALDCIHDDQRYQSVYCKFLDVILAPDAMRASDKPMLPELIEEIDRLSVGAATVPPQYRRSGKSWQQRGNGAAPAVHNPPPVSRQPQGPDHRRAESATAQPFRHGGGKKGKKGKQFNGKRVNVSAVTVDPFTVPSDEFTSGDEVKDAEPYANVSVQAIVSATNSVHTKGNKAFLVDSGATDHCVREQRLFTTFRTTKTVIRVANGKSVVATGKGDVTVFLTAADNNDVVQVVLKDVLFVPTLANNIFSTNKFLATCGTTNCSVQLDNVNSHMKVGTQVIPFHADISFCG